eukprot:TRINITY_DN27961_c2_g1_i1.p1 TRINITY_DN27961_c2_g1~~TRINITY_DN27961_c2_g1_i1.p1  ORF type:complete len:210 (+),score=56.38 TRINITY_DN27961_c2_g1_i1:80-709(+)
MRAAVALLLATLPLAAARDLLPQQFDQHVRRSGRDAFVKFYAPWCGHCKRLEPTWDKLALDYQDGWGYSAQVLIASVDCTDIRSKSLCAEHQISGYPTLRYFKGRDSPQYVPDSLGEEYYGPRDLESLRSFVSAAWRATHPDAVREAAKEPEPLLGGNLWFYAAVGSGVVAVCGAVLAVVRKMRQSSGEETAALVAEMEKPTGSPLRAA